MSQADANRKEVGLARIYLKDLSFESPASPAIFQSNWQPKVEADVLCQHKLIEKELFEVTLKLTLEGKKDDQVVFITEVEQGGLFSIKGLGQEEQDHALNVFCPTVLFPYARTNIDTVMTQGGMPALMLAPINFEGIYQQQKQQKQKQAGSGKANLQPVK